MEFVGSNLSPGRRHDRFPVKLTFGEKWTPEQIAERGKVIEMQLLATSYGQGRGRAASDSTVDYTSLVDHFGFENSDQAFIRLVELGSPYVSLSKAANEWKGTRGGVTKIVKRDAERLGLKASFKTAAKTDKDSFIFTIRQGDGVEAEVIEAKDEDSEE